MTEERSFELGLATVDPWVASGDANTSYYHSDMIGMTRFMTDSGSAEILSATYTAFGERITGTAHRYGYAGAWGYQGHDDLPYLHVGHRYYDPATGRFVQRDPVGINGGLNVYVYVEGSPVSKIDPAGLHDGGPWHWKTYPPSQRLPRPKPKPMPKLPRWAKDAGKAGMIGGTLGAVLGGIKGAIGGAALGSVAGGAGAGPGAVAGGILGTAGGYVEGFIMGVCGYFIAQAM